MNRNLLLIPALVISTMLGAQDPAAKKEVETFVNEAIAFAKATPNDFVNEICKPTGRFNVKKTNRLYLTVYDDKGKCVAHGRKVAEVGSLQWDVKDLNGVFVMQERIKLAKTKGSGWTEDVKVNPESGKKSVKHVFVSYHNGMTICCGLYDM